MCGIFGSFNHSDSVLLKKAIRCIKHRGPDSEGYFIDSDIMLGSCRLSIVDHEKGDQPIFNEDKTITIVYNGEIYNHKELRKRLEEKKHRFYTSSDTEVIVHLYEEYGSSFLKYLNGMFSFALWDSKKNELLIARDHFGIKPLYYTILGEKLFFSSEIKALLMHDEIKKELNKKKIPDYLRYRYIKSPDTFIKSIRKLEPSYFIRANKKGITKKRYFNFSFKKNINSDISTLDRLIYHSNKLRIPEEVKYGLFLSGGIDSGLLLSYMKNFREIKTFTIGFEEDTYNEFSKAKKVSDYFGTSHKEFCFSEEKAMKIFPEMIYHLEEPIADATSLATFLLAKEASKKVKVAFSGEGADELFKGYNYYRNLEIINKIPKFTKKIAYNAIGLLPQKGLSRFFSYPETIGDDGKKRLLSLLKDPSEKDAYYESISLFSKDIKEVTDLPQSDLPFKKDPLFINKKDLGEWLPDYILTRVDKMTMANSLECRVPYLDLNVADYTLRSKENYPGKVLLRKLAVKKLPKFIANQKKSPFHIPISDWFQKNNKNQFSFLEESPLIEEKIIKKEYIKKLSDKYDHSKLINSRKIWSLATLDMCYKQFILK